MAIKKSCSFEGNRLKKHLAKIRKLWYNVYWNVIHIHNAKIFT